jgi:hypothetical protein
MESRISKNERGQGPGRDCQNSEREREAMELTAREVSEKLSSRKRRSSIEIKNGQKRVQSTANFRT